MRSGDESREALLEREAELDELVRVLDASRAGRGRVALVEGPAGIGKSSLLDACAVRARERGMAVLRVLGDDVVMESSFAAVRELLWPELRARATAFEGAARLAAPVFDAEAGARSDRDRVSAVLHGLYWLVADLAAEAPMVLLVDDAQWLDAASSRFLLYLARRIDSLPVLGPRADEELCRSCQVTRGNPFYLRELALALKVDGGRPTVDLARRVRGLGVATISRRVLLRLARLGGDCERLAQALSILGPGATLRNVAALAGLERESAVEAVDRLHAADLLSAGPELSFVHPIVREAIAAQLPPARRAELHARAARILASDRGSPDQVAAHLLSAEAYGDAWIVDALRAVAREAVTRGAPEAAVSYLRRALSEPPSPEDRLGVLLELGRAEAVLPMTHDFTALREALALAEDPRERAEIAFELALALFGVLRNGDGVAVIDDALRAESELDPDLVARLDQARIGGGIGDLEEYSEQMLELGRELGAELVGMLWRPIVLLERGRSEEAAALLESLDLDIGTDLFEAMLVAHRGRVRIACGAVEAGVSDLLEVDRRTRAAGLATSALIPDWARAAALGMAALGRGGEARELAARELSEAVAFGSPRRHGVALSLCGALHPGPEGLAWLREAVVVLERSPARLEHGRAEVNLGEGLLTRGERSAAREPLRKGLDLADHCGSAALLETARAALVTSGARPRRAALTGPNALTAAERRTARMAADGLGNREIAQALFLSTKTVETHLTRVYEKLGIRARGQLPAALNRIARES